MNLEEKYNQIKEKLSKLRTSKERMKCFISNIDFVNSLFENHKVHLLTNSTDLTLQFDQMYMNGSNLEIITKEGIKKLQNVSDVSAKGYNGFEFKGGNYVLDKQKNSLLIQYS